MTPQIIPIRDESHWHELRAKHIGGSEIAALFGQSPYTTALELWLIKRGEASGEFPDNERMFWGRLLEDAVAQGVAIQKSWQVDNLKAYVVCGDTPGMGCTPDRIINHAPGRSSPGVLQIKVVDRLEFLKWEDGEPPLNYLLQLQHEIACCAMEWGALAVLVGGNELKVYEYDAHPVAMGRIKDAIMSFWRAVESGAQPKAISDDYDILREISGKYDREIDLSQDNELPMLCADAKAAAKVKNEADKQEKEAKARILQKLNGAARARCAGFTIKATTVNKKEYTVAATSFQQLTIKEEKAA